jgi:hypothetical protein
MICGVKEGWATHYILIGATTPNVQNRTLRNQRSLSVHISALARGSMSALACTQQLISEFPADRRTLPDIWFLIKPGSLQQRTCVQLRFSN